MALSWEQLRYHPTHEALWNSPKRYAAVVAGRRSGKTELAKRKIVVSLAYKKPWPDPIYAYVLPTFPQARRVAWYSLLNMIPKEWIPKDGINKTESSIKTIFGSTLYIVGMDKPHRIEGISLDGIVLDEASDHRPEVWSKTALPMLTARSGWGWQIGVPKKAGVGRADFREFFQRGMNGDPDIASYSWKSSEVWLPHQIEEAKRMMSDEAYREQCEAEWIDAGGSVYHAYRAARNLADVQYNSDFPIYVGCDFNVDPMCWVLGHWNGEVLRIFEEVELKDTNTQKTLDYLYSKYSSHNAGWRFIGDASARQRKSSASRTDYLHIRNDSRFRNATVWFPNRNPRVLDRIADVNALLCNAKDEVRLLINPKCTRLIKDFDAMSYKEKTNELEDYSGTEIGHMSDALGYLITKIAPIKLEGKAVPVLSTVSY